MSKLYIVSTPIGNLGDVTYRAIEVLAGVSRILAEDTRRTAILLRRYQVSTKLVSAHAHNEAARAAQIVAWLDEGQDLALVSDAGTPLLSDPGARIVRKVLDAGHEVVPVPGASAILAALVASGIDPEPFTFFGFVARSGKERTARLAEVAALGHASVLYESPNRVGRLLEDLAGACGPERRVAVGRELTKLHETVFRGTLAEAAAYYGEGPVRGEIVVVVAGRAAGRETTEGGGDAARELARSLLAGGARPTAAARELARRFDLSRGRAYGIVLEEARADRGEAV